MSDDDEREPLHGDVRAGLEEAIAAAAHLTAMDAGAVAAARALADKIDAWDVIVDWALDDLAERERPGDRPAVPQNDNTSLPTFLRFCEALGLTPSGRLKTAGPSAGGGRGGGKLGQLRSLPGVQGARGRSA